MKKTLFFIFLSLLCITVFSQEEVKLKNGRTIIVNPDGTWKHKQEIPTNNTFTDSRDGHVYKTVTVGTQTWMAENFAFKSDSGCWANNNDIKNVAIYGYLYNFESAKNLCPIGWHLPSLDEWKTLISNFGIKDDAGGKLKETGFLHWKAPNEGATNESGFNGLPGGCRNEIETFAPIGETGFWWTSTDVTNTIAWSILLNNDNSRVCYYSCYEKSHGFSLRYIKDK